MATRSNQEPSSITSPIPATGKARIRTYLSPTLVFLAFDWEEGKNHSDFLGFAIRRTPGFSSQSPQFLLNKVTFDPPKPNAPFTTSDKAPFQKFHWWDGSISEKDRGKVFTYEVIPVLGSGKNDLHLQSQCAASVTVTIPHVVENGIGTYFNRAVVSSQSFTEEFGKSPKGKQLDSAMAWLANGMQDAIPSFVTSAEDLEMAVYHLTDEEWVIPSLKKFTGSASIVYYLKEPPANSKAKKPSSDTVNLETVKELDNRRFSFHSRTKTNIMHDKFIVRRANGAPQAVLMGSANFTPEGLTEQANVIHTFESAALAQLYSQRQEMLTHDPTRAETAQGANWSSLMNIGDATVRAFFPPEPSHGKKSSQPGISMHTVVDAIKGAKKSAIFCLFDPTDKNMLEALFAIGEQHKMLFGLVNSISDPSRSKKALTPEDALNAPSPSAQVQVEIFHRSRKDKLVVSYDLFNAQDAPAGWLPEFSAIDLSSKSVGNHPTIQPPPGKQGKKSYIPAVHIHHKFILIDAETDSPTIFTGSANMSNNSVFNNDENLLEITTCPRLAQIYLAEFMRLYEHYRARALWDWSHQGKAGKTLSAGAAKTKLADTFVLKTSAKDWVKDAYNPSSSTYIMRVNLASPLARAVTA